MLRLTLAKKKQRGDALSSVADASGHPPSSNVHDMHDEQGSDKTAAFGMLEVSLLDRPRVRLYTVLAVFSTGAEVV